MKKPKLGKRTISVVLPAEMIEDLSSAGAREQRKLGAQIRKVLADWCAAQQQTQPQPE